MGETMAPEVPAEKLDKTGEMVDAAMTAPGAPDLTVPKTPAESKNALNEEAVLAAAQKKVEEAVAPDVEATPAPATSTEEEKPTEPAKKPSWLGRLFGAK
ncbi:MAG: hypothetical protein AAB360_02590 [Patescibacteria group bacterium]